MRPKKFTKITLKQASVLFVTSFFAGQVNAASLTCVNSEKSTRWSVAADGVVSHGRIAIEQPMTSMRVKLSDTGEEKEIKFNRLEASPFHGGCNIDFENALSGQTSVVFDCGLHGYGRGYFYPSGMYCHNDDWSQVQVSYDDKAEIFTWSINYIFGTCREHGKNLDLVGDGTVVATFTRDQCRFVP
jgi:hypothetical protein